MFTGSLPVGEWRVDCDSRDASGAPGPLRPGRTDTLHVARSSPETSSQSTVAVLDSVEEVEFAMRCAVNHCRN
jgi:hypothetical protein